jgi:hypothetical protein
MTEDIDAHIQELQRQPSHISKNMSSSTLNGAGKLERDASSVGSPPLQSPLQPSNRKQSNTFSMESDTMNLDNSVKEAMRIQKLAEKVEQVFRAADVNNDGVIR